MRQCHFAMGAFGVDDLGLLQVPERAARDVETAAAEFGRERLQAVEADDRGQGMVDGRLLGDVVVLGPAHGIGQAHGGGRADDLGQAPQPDGPGAGVFVMWMSAPNGSPP